mgnify:CR=1 FL=1
MNENPIRIIPVLDIKNGLLIKGINLEGLRVLGKASNFSNHYYKNGADEICYIDNVATLYGTNNLSKFITETAKNIFIKLCERFRSPHLWKKIKNKWHLRHTCNKDGTDD